MSQWDSPPSTRQRGYAAPDHVGSDARTKEELVRERMAAEKRAKHKREEEAARRAREQERRVQQEREQLIADIEEISAQIYAILESWDWSRAELWTFTVKPRTWWRWRAVTEEGAALKFARSPGTTYWMASHGTVCTQHTDPWTGVSIRNDVIRITNNKRLMDIKGHLESFVRAPTFP